MKWISVKDKHPESRDLIVLVYLEDGEHEFASWIEGCSLFDVDNCGWEGEGYTAKVTHWAYLTEPEAGE